MAAREPATLAATARPLLEPVAPGPPVVSDDTGALGGCCQPPVPLLPVPAPAVPSEVLALLWGGSKGPVMDAECTRVREERKGDDSNSPGIKCLGTRRHTAGS